MRFVAARMAGGELISGLSYFRMNAVLWALLVAMLLAGAANAQTMYKYRGADGEWIYTDRKPSGDAGAEELELKARSARPTFKVSHRFVNRRVELIADNDFYAPIEVGLEFENLSGLEYPNPDNRLRWVVEPRSTRTLLSLDVLDNEPFPYAEYSYKYLPGDPSISHNAIGGYQVPFSAGKTFPITQAYPLAITHATVDSYQAVDIAMPIGTDVMAARGGVVFDVVSNKYKGGIEKGYAQDANIIRILHNDGTFALYAHLNWNTIRVKPGDRVEAGEYIADSGNTGFSSGPHLHFAVQRNVGLRVDSLPIVFKGAGSAMVTPQSGNALTGYK